MGTNPSSSAWSIMEQSNGDSTCISNITMPLDCTKQKTKILQSHKLSQIYQLIANSQNQVFIAK